MKKRKMFVIKSRMGDKNWDIFFLFLFDLHFIKMLVIAYFFYCNLVTTQKLRVQFPPPTIQNVGGSYQSGNMYGSRP